MAPVVTLEAPILQVHDVAGPGSVGYGATHLTRAGMRIATVPVGYADGYLRAASGRATARIAGQEVPLAGRVSMDLISLDVSALPADAVRPGTMVELIGGPDGHRPLGRGRGHDRLRSIDATWQPVRASVYPAGSQEGRAMNPLAVIGRIFLSFLTAVGDLTLFAGRAIVQGLSGPFYPRAILRQMVDIGYYSLPVVGLTAIFTGMVLALQSYTGFSRFEAESAVATIVVLSMTRELGPVLAGLMVAGRVGASMAAEIGTMRVTEQIDALTTLSTDPFKYLVWPRLIAGLLMLPLLVIVADIIGVFGGYIVGIYKLGFGPYEYINNTFEFLETEDVVSGLVKAAVFGFLVALMGCYQGYHSEGGAQGVGAATTKAVVSASILILTANYVVTEMFFRR